MRYSSVSLSQTYAIWFKSGEIAGLNDLPYSVLNGIDSKTWPCAEVFVPFEISQKQIAVTATAAIIVTCMRERVHLRYMGCGGDFRTGRELIPASSEAKDES